MPNFSRAGALALVILLSVFSLLVACGRGGGGNTSVTPTPSQQGIEYRLAMILPTPNGGKEITTGGKELQNVTIYQGKETTFQVRHEYRSHQGSTTTPWTEIKEACRLNVSVYGSESGRPLPNLGLSGGQDQRIQGNLQLEFFPPLSGNQGFAMIELCVTETGAYLNVGIWVAAGGGQVNPPPPAKTCRQTHPTHENINGFWWDCTNDGATGVWENTGVPVNNPPPPPPSKDVFPLIGQLGGFYSGSGQQSLTLELKPLPTGVGFINWEIVSGPSGAMTVPLGAPAVQCEFYYTASGTYKVRATPFESEQSFDSGKPPVGKPAEFTVVITAG